MDSLQQTMNTPVLSFFNNKGGVGKTSLVYHLSWMFAKLGKRLVVTDLDPQANLTAIFLDDDEIEALWESKESGATIYDCVKPLSGTKDLVNPKLKQVGENLHLIPGSMDLSNFEDALSDAWPKSLGDNAYRYFRILTSFYTIIQMGAKEAGADLILVDVGPNLGAINRTALLSSDHVVIPVGADIFSLQGLKNLGPTLRKWKKSWEDRLKNWNELSHEKNEDEELILPEGKMNPLGYLCHQHGVRLDKPVKAYNRWVSKVPEIYRKFILDNKSDADEKIQPEDDPHCLATIKHYRSLIPLSQEHRKPIFDLTPADGAIGSHAHTVKQAERDFEELAIKIGKKIGIFPQE